MTSENNHEYYAIELVSAGNDKIALCREIRLVKNCDLTTAKNIIETPNSFIIYAIDEKSANELKNKLEKYGAEVRTSKVLSSTIFTEVYQISDIHVSSNPPKIRGNMPKQIQNNTQKQLLWNILLVSIVIFAGVYLHFSKQETLFEYVLGLILCVIRFFTYPHSEGENLLKIILNTCLFAFGISLAWEPPVSSFHCTLFFFLSILIPLYDLFRFNKTEKSKTIALVLCFFLGWCGGHKFYLRKDSAWLYLIFFWTGIPALLAIWDFIVILLFDTDCLATNPEERLDKVLKDNNFTVSKTIEVKENTLILFDNKKNEILFFYDNPYATPETKLLKYEDILDFELSTDGNSRLQGRGIASFAGALITDTLGLSATAGAVIGSVSGDKKMLQSATSIVVNLKINNLQNPLIVVVFLDIEVDKDNAYYSQSLTKAQELLATLTYIKNKVQKEAK